MNTNKFDVPSFWVGVIVGIFGFLFMILIFTIDDIYAGRHLIMVPDCPVEDSCYPEYFHGEWYIFEGER